MNKTKTKYHPKKDEFFSGIKANFEETKKCTERISRK